MENLKFEQSELEKQYQERVAQLKAIAEAPDFQPQVMWNATAAKYAGTITKVNALLNEPELKAETSTLLSRKIENFLSKCSNPEFHIALVGAIKAGKSSLINAILGDDLASTEVTPETAALTKFRRSKGKDYVLVKFYSNAQWQSLWASASKTPDSKFMEEYRTLQADAERDKWVNHESQRVECGSKDELKSEIKKWTSSQSATHYFVSEVEVGLKEFDLPDGVVLVDTPGLNDAVSYRSDITKDYIDRANAVFVCVKADKLSGPELATICGVFSNARNYPEKVYVIATQQDSLNDPVEDWKKQRKVWLDHLKRTECYGDHEMAERNLLSTSAYFYTLLKTQDEFNGAGRNKRAFQLNSTLFKMQCYPEELPDRYEELLEFTGIDRLKHRMKTEIVERYQALLVKDIQSDYTSVRESIVSLLKQVRDSQMKTIDASQKGLDEIKQMMEENRQKLDAARQDQEEMEELVAEMKRVTRERTANLVAAIRGLGGES